MSYSIEQLKEVSKVCIHEIHDTYISPIYDEKSKMIHVVSSRFHNIKPTHGDKHYFDQKAYPYDKKAPDRKLVLLLSMPIEYMQKIYLTKDSEEIPYLDSQLFFYYAETEAIEFLSLSKPLVHKIYPVSSCFPDSFYIVTNVEYYYHLEEGEKISTFRADFDILCKHKLKEFMFKFVLGEENE